MQRKLQYNDVTLVDIRLFNYFVIVLLSLEGPVFVHVGMQDCM